MKALLHQWSRKELRDIVAKVMKFLPDNEGVVRIRQTSWWGESTCIEYSVSTEDLALWRYVFEILDRGINDGHTPVVGKASYLKDGRLHDGGVVWLVDRVSVSRLIPLILRYRQMCLRHERKDLGPRPMEAPPQGTSVMPSIIYPFEGKGLYYQRINVCDADGTIIRVFHSETDLDTLDKPVSRATDSAEAKVAKVNHGRVNVIVVGPDGLTKHERKRLNNLSRKEFTDHHEKTTKSQEIRLKTLPAGHSDMAIQERLKRLAQLRTAWSNVNDTDKKLLKWWKGQKETDRKVVNRMLRQEFERLWAGYELVLYPKLPKNLVTGESPSDLFDALRLANVDSTKPKFAGEGVAWSFRPRPTAKWAWNEAVRTFFAMGWLPTKKNKTVQLLKQAYGSWTTPLIPVPDQSTAWTQPIMNRIGDIAEDIMRDSQIDPLNPYQVVITYEDFFVYCLGFAKKLHRRNPRRQMPDVICDVAQYVTGSMAFAIYQWSTGDKLNRRTTKLRNQWWRYGWSESELQAHEAELNSPKVIGWMPPRTFETLYSVPKKRVPKTPSGEFDESRWSEADWWDYENQLRIIPMPTKPRATITAPVGNNWGEMAAQRKEMEATKKLVDPLHVDGSHGLGRSRRFLMMAGATAYELTDELYGKPRMLMIRATGTIESLKGRKKRLRGWVDSLHPDPERAKRGETTKVWGWKTREHLSATVDRLMSAPMLEDVQVTHQFRPVTIATYDTIPDYTDPAGRRTKRVIRNLTISQVRQKEGKLEFLEAIEGQKARMASAGKDFYSDPEARLQRKEEKMILRRIGRMAIGRFTELELEAIKHFLRHGEFRRGDHPKNILKKLRDTGVMMGLKL